MNDEELIQNNIRMAAEVFKGMFTEEELKKMELEYKQMLAQHSGSNDKSE